MAARLTCTLRMARKIVVSQGMENARCGRTLRLGRATCLFTSMKFDRSKSNLTRNLLLTKRKPKPSCRKRKDSNESSKTRFKGKNKLNCVKKKH